MEDPEEDWAVEEYYYPGSSGEEDESKSRVSWLWNRGLNLGKKVMITGVAISSAPIVLPPLFFVSALGFAASVPFGVMLASYTCTEKLMNKLLPMPVLSQSWEYETDQFGEAMVTEDMVDKQVADLREDIETRFEIVEDENKELQEGLDESSKYKGYEEVDKKPLIGESKNDEKPLPEVKRVIVVAASEEKGRNDDVMKPDELIVVSRVVKIEEKSGELSTDSAGSLGQKEGTTAAEEKIRGEVGDTGESGKKNKKKNKHHSKKLHKILGKKEDKHEENVEGKINEESSVLVSSKSAGAQGSATNGHNRVQDRKTKGTEPKSSGMNTIAADEKEGKTLTSNPERKETGGVNHKPKQPGPITEPVVAKSPKKMILSEEKIWDQIDALRVIVGYTASRHKSCIEELKALYIFTGVEPPSSFDKATDLEEAADKLQFLMSVLGVK